jgi:hypothetical protein
VVPRDTQEVAVVEIAESKRHVLSVQPGRGARKVLTKFGLSKTGVLFFAGLFVLASQEFDILLPKNYNHLGYALAQLVEYKPEGWVFDSRWSHWNFSVT